MNRKMIKPDKIKESNNKETTPSIEKRKMNKKIGLHTLVPGAGVRIWRSKILETTLWLLNIRLRLRLRLS